MLRRFGNLIWKQSREISVLNYPKHVVYAIYTNQGYIYVSKDKETGKIEEFENDEIEEQKGTFEIFKKDNSCR